MRRSAATIYLLILVVPMLGLIPWSSGAVAVLTACATLTAAFHGMGVLVARISGRRVEALLAVQWGLAAMVAVGGLGLLLHVAHIARWGWILAGLAVHTLAILAGWRERTSALAAWLASRESHWALLAVAAFGALALLYILGAAGDISARPFDDDGHHLAQIKRLLDTGRLADPIGFARDSQLGGQLLLELLGTLAHGLELSRWLDNGLCGVLAIALALTRIRPRDASSVVWSLLVIAAIPALAFLIADPSAWWTATGLLLALHFTLEDHATHDSTFPIVLVAGALATLRSELLPVTAVALFAAWWIRRTSWRTDLIRIALVLATPALVILPYLIERMVAWSAAPMGMLALGRGATIVQLGLFVAIFVAAAAVLAVLLDREQRWPALITAAGLAGILSQLFGDRPYATHFVWPLAVALGLSVIVRLAKSSELRILSLVVSAVVCLAIYQGRDAAGRLRWSRRVSNLVYNIEYLGHAAPTGAAYDKLVTRIPAGATVAVHVGRPELLDYARNRIFDLRTPRTAKLRSHGWVSGASRVQRLVEAIGAEWLLVDDDHAAIARMQRDPFARFWCATPQPDCADDLEVLSHRFPVVARDGQTRLLRLRSVSATGP